MKVLLLLGIIPSLPENIGWITSYNYLQPDMIVFMWSTHSLGLLDCHVTTSFNIVASRECGSCPTTTNHTTVTCTDVPSNGGMCMFAVQAVVCGSMIGESSNPVLVDTTVTTNKNSKENIMYYVGLSGS